ncbi:MAG: translation initiation factor IF-3 [Bacteroidales bacterium]|nr:translation initiation factor IF-3 [Bacteroidales bacterium]
MNSTPKPVKSGKPFAARKKEAPHRINENITSQTVRVVGENFEPKIVSLREALALAEQFELDLVEISPNANPPVCKVMDYQKYLYEQKKKAKEIKANSAKTTVKEIHMGPQTDDHDFNFKLNHAIRFLKDGYKVKVMVTFRGRAIVYKDQGELLLLRFAQSLEEVGKLDQMPTLLGRNMTIMVSPKPVKK